MASFDISYINPKTGDELYSEKYYQCDNCEYATLAMSHVGWVIFRGTGKPHEHAFCPECIYALSEYVGAGFETREDEVVEATYSPASHKAAYHHWDSFTWASTFGEGIEQQRECARYIEERSRLPSARDLINSRIDARINAQLREGVMIISTPARYGRSVILEDLRLPPRHELQVQLMQLIGGVPTPAPSPLPPACPTCGNPADPKSKRPTCQRCSSRVNRR